MTDYNAMLIDLLNDKIHRLEQEKIEQRKEINRLKSEIRALKRSCQLMRKNSYIKAFCLLCVTVLLLSGCGSSAPETLYQSENVQVVRSGNKTAVLDLVSDKEYNYTTRLVKRSKAVTEPYTTVDTDTVKIDIIPHGLRVYDKAENTVFTVKRNFLRKRG